MDSVEIRFRFGRVVLVCAAAFGFLWIAWALFWSIRIFTYGPFTPLLIADRLTDFVQIGVGGLYCLLGAVVVAKSERREGVIVLGGYLIAQGFATGYLHSLYEVMHWTDWRITVARLGVNLFAYAAAMRTAQLFPRRLKRSHVAELFSNGIARGAFWRFISLFLKSWRVWLLAIIVLAAVPLAKLELVFHLGQLLVILIVVGTMTANYKTGNAETQRKIYWLLTGAFIFLIARVISLTVQVLLEWLGLTTIHIGPDAQPFYVVGTIRTAVWSAANIGLLACVLAAVFYTGVIDPRLVLKRTAVYSSGFGVLLFIFAVFVNYVSEVIAEMLQITEGLIEAIAGALVAVAFKPVHDWLSKLAERILPSRSTHKSELEAAA